MKILNHRYAVVNQPRSGGMATVYPAHDLKNDAKKVAIKVFGSKAIDDEILKEAYDREIRALQELKHPSIVELLDHGIDRETGGLFLVLEWVDSDLSDQLTKLSFPGWDSFYAEFARPLLQALDFAHSRQVIHRDLKPRNILVDASRIPKLADFGISKIKRWLEPGITLNEFASRPFCPQELDDGSYTYTRDVFGFAALCIQCMTDKQLHSYDDLYLALDSIDVPSEIHAILSKALSKNPIDRFVNASVLFAETDVINSARQKLWTPKHDVYVDLPPSVYRQLVREFPNSTHDELMSLIIKDLNLSCGLERFEGPAGKAADQFSIAGSAFSYHMALDRDTKNRLVILNVKRLSTSLLERKRDRAYQPYVRFVHGQPEHIEAAVSSLITIQEGLEEFESEIRQREIEYRDQELFRTWLSILKVKSVLEKRKEQAIRYKQCRIVDNRAFFQIEGHVSEEVIGQTRVVDEENRRLLIGDIEAVQGTSLVLLITRLNVDDLPISGELSIDVSAAREALNRQKSAVGEIRFNRAVRSDLKDLMIHPEKCRAPMSVSDVDFFQKDLDLPKREAVSRALGNDDILLVQGPPGTGKTTFITELILQVLKRTPNARILLTSQTHVALDNAVERLQEFSSGFRIVRIGKGDNTRISKAVEKLLIERQIDQWRAEVMEAGRRYLQEWAQQHGISRQQYEVSTALRSLSVVLRESVNTRITIQKLQEDINRLKTLLKSLTEDKGEEAEEDPSQLVQPEDITEFDDDASLDEPLDKDNLEERLRGVEAELTKIISEKGVLDVKAKGLKEELNKIDADAAEQLTESDPDELENWAETYMPTSEYSQHFKQLVDTHSEWEARLGRAADFEAALIASSQVIAGTCIGIAGVKGMRDLDFDLCIVDEASKATPTETLVPMSRAHRWVFVGDSKQLPPFIEEGLDDKQLLTENRIDEKALRATLFDRFERCLPTECITALNMQHRMVPQIGSLISECFYGNKLLSAPKELDKTFSAVLPKPVIWFTTSSNLQRFESQSGFSYTNTHEARLISDILNRMNGFADRAGRKFSVSVLSGYSEQKRLLERTLAKSHFTALDVSFNTVDTVQGRQFDVSIYSVTRSNDRRKLGFLAELRRLNVALSRGRQYLIMVGDHVFARSADGENPFRRVVEYIEEHPQDCTIREYKN